MATLDLSSHEKTLAYLKEFYDTFDRMDVESFRPFFTNDMTLRYANNPPIVGYEAFDKIYTQFLSSFSHAKHNITTLDIVPPRILLAVEVEWVVKNDPENKKFVIPAFTVIYPDDAKDGERRMKKVEIYIDTCELMERIKTVNPT